MTLLTMPPATRRTSASADRSQLLQSTAISGELDEESWGCTVTNHSLPGLDDTQLHTCTPVIGSSLKQPASQSGNNDIYLPTTLIFGH